MEQNVEVTLPFESILIVLVFVLVYHATFIWKDLSEALGLTLNPLKAI